MQNAASPRRGYISVSPMHMGTGWSSVLNSERVPIAVTSPGDVVLPETLTYAWIKAATAYAGVRLVGVQIDEDDIIPPDALNAANLNVQSSSDGGVREKTGAVSSVWAGCGPAVVVIRLPVLGFVTVSPVGVMSPLGGVK
jgi:hypothetical protein